MDYLRPAFDEALSDISHTIVEPQLPPAAGGILLALEAAGEELDGERLSNLRQADV